MKYTPSGGWDEDDDDDWDRRRRLTPTDWRKPLTMEQMAQFSGVQLQRGLRGVYYDFDDNDGQWKRVAPGHSRYDTYLNHELFDQHQWLRHLQQQANAEFNRRVAVAQAEMRQMPTVQWDLQADAGDVELDPLAAYRADAGMDAAGPK